MATRTTVPAAKPAKKKSTSAVDALAADTSSLTQLPLDVIDEHPDNPRKDLGDLTELAASIEAQGVLQNVTVMEDPDKPGRYLALLGHRRVAASRLAGKETIPARIVRGLSRAEQIELMLVENLQRTDLTPVEEGRSYQGLLDLEIPMTEISRATGRAVSTIKNRLTVASLPEVFTAAITERQITLQQAVDLATIAEKLPERFNAIERRLSLGASQTTIDWDITEALRLIRANEAHDLLLASAEAEGIRVTDQPTGTAWESMTLSMLRIEPENHTNCPGHCYSVGGTSTPTLDLTCDQAKEQHPEEWASARERAGYGVRERQLTDEERAEFEAIERLGEAMEASGARAVRWLAHQFTHGDAAARAAATEFAVSLADAGHRLEIYSAGLREDLAEIDLPEDVWSSLTGTDRLVFAALADFALGKLNVSGFDIRMACAERVHWAIFRMRAAHEVLTWLRDQGVDLNAAEQDLLDRINAAGLVGAEATTSQEVA